MLSFCFRARYHATVRSNADSILSLGCHRVQPENMILMQARNRIANPGRAVAPHLHELGRDALDRPDFLIARCEVVGGSEFWMLGEEYLSRTYD
jgi:hypothetical protein